MTAAYPPTGSKAENVQKVVSIVDDDESVRTAVGSLLQSLGMIAHVFPSAEAFLSSPYVAETACLISDVQMPGISGVELQNRLAADNRHIPIIFISAFRSEDVTNRALGAGAICFLQKPFDAKTLMTCVEEALNCGTATSTHI